jgi:hypothetical protein
LNFSNTVTEVHGMERGIQFEILPLDLEAGNNRGTLAFEKELTRIVEETNGFSEYLTIDQSRPVERITEFAQRVSMALRGQYLLSYNASNLSESMISSIRVRLSGELRQYRLRFRPVSSN